MANRSDNFNRANSPTVIGTPSDGGSGWGAINTVGNWGIDTNQLYNSTAVANAQNFIEVGTANLEMSLVWGGSVYASSSPVNAMFPRYLDANNWTWVQVSGLKLQLSKMASGVFSNIGTAYSGTILSGDTISVSINASGNIVVKQNGVTRITHTDNNAPTAHYVGLYANNYSGYRWDDFVVTDLNSSSSIIPVILNHRRWV